MPSGTSQPAWAAHPLTPELHGAQLRRAVLPSTIGTTIEWYDFFLYSTVTGLVSPAGRHRWSRRRYSPTITAGCRLRCTSRRVPSSALSPRQ